MISLMVTQVQTLPRSLGYTGNITHFTTEKLQLNKNAISKIIYWQKSQFTHQLLLKMLCECGKNAQSQCRPEHRRVDVGDVALLCESFKMFFPKLESCMSCNLLFYLMDSLPWCGYTITDLPKPLKIDIFIFPQCFTIINIDL